MARPPASLDKLQQARGDLLDCWHALGPPLADSHEGAVRRRPRHPGPPPPVPSSRQDVEGLMHDMQRRYLVPMQREVRQ